MVFSNGEVRQVFDPYSFLPSLSEDDVFLFNEGNEHKLYENLGARGRVDGDRLRLAAVEPGSPAATAGLTTGDTVLEVNGMAVAGFVNWAKAITAGGAGGKVKARIRIFRGGRVHTRFPPEPKITKLERSEPLKKIRISPI